ncbi:MAG: Sec-independent protein translocase protein TatB [Pseudomonadota bacterium]
MSLLPQFGFLELLLVAALALIVVGPKDLPRLMRSAGQALAQARRMAAEFTSAFDQMARETEMEEMRKEIEALKNENPIAETFADAEQTLKDAERSLKDAVKPPPETAAPSAAALSDDNEPASTGDNASDAVAPGASATDQITEAKA